MTDAHSTDDFHERLEGLAREACGKECWKSSALALETLHKLLSGPVVLNLIAENRAYREAEDKLRTALEHFDATSAMCPFNRSPTPPKDKPCPICNAEKSEGCRREITGAFGFVYSARAALTPIQQGGQSHG